jgi:hypothetical protein
MDALTGKVTLAWSFMHEDENSLCPFLDRKTEVNRLSSLCKKRIAPERTIQTRAVAIIKMVGASPKDALHYACAEYVGADYFISCDDRLIKQIGRLDSSGKMKPIKVMNPIAYI